MAEDQLGRSHESAVDAVQAWVLRTVVGLNLCPFAKAALPGLRVVACAAATPGDAVLPFVHEANALLRLPAETPATTLCVFPEGFSSFDDFWDLVCTLEASLPPLGLVGRLQLASFHPDYCFEGVAADDPANATNRSPWPVVHLLRVADVTVAVDRHPDAAGIADRNVVLLRSMAPRDVAALRDG